MRKTILLDFDGVICDSIEECLVSSWNAYHNCLITSTETIPESLQNFFYKYRPFVRPAKEYFILHRAYDNKHTQDLTKKVFRQLLMQYESEMIDYEKVFFEKRNKLKNSGHWLPLHKLYDNVKDFMVDHNERFFIVTTKDRDSVERLTTYFGIRERVINIFSKEDGANKKLLINKLVKEHTELIKNTVLHFIDDNEMHLKDVEYLKLELHLATWGYLVNKNQKYFNEINNLTEIL